MYSTLNMTLTSWDLPGDDFDHTQLDANWKAIDAHDHSAGRGKQIPTAGIRLKAITTDLLNDLAVTTAKVIDAAITEVKLANQAVTTVKLADDAVTTAKLDDGSVTLPKLDSTVLPLGSVMLWWRPPGSGSTPGGGWEIMDGRPWSSISNSLSQTTGNIPDMRNAFARGTDLSNVGTTGGSDTANLSHSHGVLSHSHTLAPHAHPISQDGSHVHLWANGFHMATRTNCFDRNFSVQDAYSSHVWANTYYSMYVQNLLSNPDWFQRLPDGTTEQEIDGRLDMDPSGNHSHGGATGASGTLTTNASTASTDVALNVTSTVPHYVGLCYIMRVR